MQKRLMSYGLGLALGALLAWPAAAQSGGGMNSNKPGARPGLSGVNPNDLKLKPNEKFSGKEPAK